MELKKITKNRTFKEVETYVSQPPYNIRVVENDEFYLLKYSQIDSKMSCLIAQECRGIILCKSNNQIVCHPFHKFFNHGEKNAAKIDWNTAHVQEKIDGSIIKVWRHKNKLHISSNGCIDAFEAKTPLRMSLGELFLQAAKTQNLSLRDLHSDYTYIFELVSPCNKNVITYPETAIYHLGTRSNLNGKEKEVDIGIQKPQTYSFNSFNKMVEAAQKLPFNEEGYVVVDANYNRIKVKSPAYVAAHHLRNNGILTPKRFLAIVLDNEVDEFISYFPEFKDKIIEAKEKLNAYISQVKDDWIQCSAQKNLRLAEARSPKQVFEQFRDHRKEFAAKAQTTLCPSIMFRMYDKHENTIEEMVKNYDPEKLAEMIGLKF